jgi:hypothetical protein
MSKSILSLLKPWFVSLRTTVLQIYGSCGHEPLLRSAIPTSSYYSTASNKHMIKKITNSNHDVANHAQTQPDILTWFNGH